MPAAGGASAPTTPSRPTIASSTVLPSSSGVTREQMPPPGKYTY